MSQSDVVFVIPNFVMRWGKYHPARDPKESFSLNMDVCHSFLKRHHLRGETVIHQSLQAMQFTAVQSAAIEHDVLQQHLTRDPEVALHCSAASVTYRKQLKEAETMY